MNAPQAARIVFIAGVLEAVFVLARARQSGQSTDKTVKSLWGIGVLTLGLSVAADFVPQVAGPFAILVLVALAAKSRGELGQVLGVSGAPSSSTQTRKEGGT